MRQDITPWTIRGMGLAVGVAIVVGLIALAIAAGGVLVLVFIAILLASALEPVVGLIRDRLPLGRGATILVVYVTFFVTSSASPSSWSRPRSRRARRSPPVSPRHSTRSVRGPGPSTRRSSVTRSRA
jgi:hypothetical protein